MITIEVREKGKRGAWIEIARVDGVELFDLKVDGQDIDSNRVFGTKQLQKLVKAGKVCWRDHGEGPWPNIKPARVIWLADPQTDQAFVLVPADWLFDAIARAIIDADAGKYSRVRLR
jgi:hypothetical protein